MVHLIARSRHDSVESPDRRRPHPPGGGLLPGDHGGGHPLRRRGPPGLPTPGPGAVGVGARGGVGDLRPGHHRRRIRPGHRARRGPPDPGGRRWSASGASPRRPVRRPASSNWSTSPGRTPASGGSAWTGPGGPSGGAWRGTPGRRGLRLRRSRLRELGGAGVRRGKRDPVRTGPPPEPLRGADLHQALPGGPGFRRPDEVQSGAGGGEGSPGGGGGRLPGERDHLHLAGEVPPGGREPGRCTFASRRPR
jgi:hypothetical protein